jgi:hypothetical protein
LIFQVLKSIKHGFYNNFFTTIRVKHFSILAICKVLNADDLFIQNINELVKSNASNGLLFKAEHFFLPIVFQFIEKLK